MKVYLEDDQDKPLGGTCSHASWNSTLTKEALRELFNCTDDERITEIIINKKGIKAFFKKTC
jgi:hypothetical protein